MAKFLNQFTEEELRLMERLARFSPVETNLKTMKKMDIKVSQLQYCRTHLHVLPPEEASSFMQRVNSLQDSKQHAAYPGVALGLVSLL